MTANFTGVIPFPPDLLAGRLFLVTGGTRGIGFEIAAQLLETGARVVICGRSSDQGATAISRLRDRREAECHFLSADLLDPESCRSLFAGITATGTLSGLIHCANGAVPGAGGRFEDVSPSAFRPALDNALLMLMQVAHEAVPSFAATGGGSIVAFASDSGKIAGANQTMVGATRAGIMMFIRSLALETASQGITVNCISPSFVAGTETWGEVMAGPGAPRAVRAAERAGLGLPDAGDVARLAVFLSSAWARRLTGQVISINGGVSAA